MTLKIAVLLNGLSASTPAIKSSFTTAISSTTESSSSVPTIDFYDPIVAQIYPDPTQYDLIVLSGGTADPMGSDPWVLNLQAYLKNTVAEYPKQKIVGICWGHQTLSVTFGGIIESMSSPEIGVTPIPLTHQGKSFFPFASSAGKLNIHEFHRREITTPAAGFIQLAEGNQVFVNEGNTILSFQGHPELNEGLGKMLLAGMPRYMGVDEGEKGVLEGKMAGGHDGVRVWGRILEWVGE